MTAAMADYIHTKFGPEAHGECLVGSLMRLASNELAAHDAFRCICVAASTDLEIAEMLRSEETIENVVLRALNSTLVTSTTDLRKDSARGASEKIRQATEGLRWDVGSSTSIRCKKCKGSDVTIIMRQSRSLDEGMSAEYRCLTCENRWRMR